MKTILVLFVAVLIAQVYSAPQLSKEAEATFKEVEEPESKAIKKHVWKSCGDVRPVLTTKFGVFHCKITLWKLNNGKCKPRGFRC